MSLLIATGTTGWLSDDALARDLRRMAPEMDIRTAATLGDPQDIKMIAVSRLQNDLIRQLANLELVQKLGAGVETLVAHPDLPRHVRIARLKPDAPAREIAEFFLAYVLRVQRNMDQHDRDQENATWRPIEPRETPDTTIGVLGLGHIGRRTACLFRDLGFQVLGWSRSPKAIEGVRCLTGDAGLNELLSVSDYVAAILPSTPQTRDLFDAAMFDRMKDGAVFLNAGRGDLVVETDLVAALEKGRPASAVLDVVRSEPLPPGDPLWRHPKVIITPHVSGWHLGDALKDVVENYRRLTSGDPLLHAVDRQKGY